LPKFGVLRFWVDFAKIEVTEAKWYGVEKMKKNSQATGKNCTAILNCKEKYHETTLKNCLRSWYRM